MDPLEEQLAQLNLLNSRPLSPCIKSGQHHAAAPLPTAGKVAALISSLQDGGKCQPHAAAGASVAFDSVTVDVVGAKLKTFTAGAGAISPKKVGPIVPPKPHKKKQSTPEVPQSRLVKPACEPLYSQRLQSLDSDVARRLKLPSREPLLQRKQPFYATQHSLYDKTSKVTLDNPAILEQQLEALAHHKKQLEKKGLLLQQQDQQHHSPQQLPDEAQKTLTNSLMHIPKLSSTSLISQEVLRPNDYAAVIYSNLRPHSKQAHAGTSTITAENAVYKNVGCGNRNQYDKDSGTERSNIYSNLMFGKGEENFDDLPPPPPDVLSLGAVDDANSEYLNHSIDDEVPPPPSPVSSSYSELRRATDVFSKKPFAPNGDEMGGKGVCYPAGVHCAESAGIEGKLKAAPPCQTYMNMNYGNDYNSYSPTLHNNSQDSADYYGYGSCSQSSSTYESIYEPINPRSSSQLSTRSNYQLYAPYMNGSQLKEGTGGGLLSHSSSANISSIGASGANTPLYPAANPNGAVTDVGNGHCLKYTSNNKQQKEAEVEALTDFLVHSLDSGNDVDSYGICFKCNERVLGENSGCTAMDQIYHISCFTCSQCQINLQGKPFYALDGKPFCEYDYLQTLEKCSVCMKPILERILRATGKPYHPQCFTCVVCGNSLDGIPFTVDATNQNYCIADFHKKFAPRCCVCKEPIMPEPGEEETIRVVALDRSFHFECYKCEDCGLLLSSEAEGRGCYPLDDHVLCKSCNAKRVQMLTNRMTTEL